MIELFTNLPEIYSVILPLILIAFVFAFLLTPIVAKLAIKFNFIDLPSHLRDIRDKTRDRRIHTTPIPKAGGAAVIIPFVIISVAVFGLSSRTIVGLLVGVSIIFITGLIDDRFNLPGKVQFIFQWLAAFCVVFAGANTPIINIPFDGIIDLNIFRLDLWMGYGIDLPGDLITAFWIVLITNALNWVNGSDGLAEGISAITATGLMFVSIDSGNNFTAVLSAIFLGSMLGFLPFNIPPAKIFSGAGGPTYGFILGSLAILSGAKLSTAILLLALPILDMSYVIFNRIKTHKTLNPIKLMNISDKSHFHHRLISMGFNAKQVALIEYTIVAVASTIAILTTNLEKLTLVAMAFTLLVLLITITRVFSIKNKRLIVSIKDNNKTEDKKLSPEDRYSY